MDGDWHLLEQAFVTSPPGFCGARDTKYYTSLKTAHGIDTQVSVGHLIHDGPFQLNYGSINNNWGRFKKKVHLYDYKVYTAEDLGKLYLEPHMAKFTGTVTVIFMGLTQSKQLCLLFSNGESEKKNEINKLTLSACTITGRPSSSHCGPEIDIQIKHNIC